MTHARTILPAAALALALAPPAFAGGPPPPTLIRADCVHEVSAPARIVLACGDANAVLTGITWTKWGGAAATATATLNANTCDPSCAGGTFKEYPVTVRADRRRRCSGATFGYARLRITYTGDRPAGAGPVIVWPDRCPGTRRLGKAVDNGVTFTFSAVRRGAKRAVLRVVASRGGTRVTGRDLPGVGWFPLTTTGAVDTGGAPRSGAAAAAFIRVSNVPAGGSTKFTLRLVDGTLRVSVSAIL